MTFNFLLTISKIRLWACCKCHMSSAFKEHLESFHRGSGQFHLVPNFSDVFLHQPVLFWVFSVIFLIFCPFPFKPFIKHKTQSTLPGASPYGGHSPQIVSLSVTVISIFSEFLVEPHTNVTILSLVTIQSGR